MKKVLKVCLSVIASLVALALVLLAAVYIAFIYKSNPKKIIRYNTTNPMITHSAMISAHRCGGGIMPEETLMAFKNCAENPDFKPEFFEFDLHVTKDHQLVLLHDDELDRTSDSEKVFGYKGVRAEEKTLAELKQLNMGAKFVSEDGTKPYENYSGNNVPDDLRILTVQEALDYLCSIDDYRYIIEVKNTGDFGKLGVDILYAELKERNMLDRCLFGSFDKEICDYVTANYPDFMRGACSSEVVDFYIAAFKNLEDFNPPYSALYLPYGDIHECKFINSGTAKFINYAHKNNISVQYWTINKKSHMEYLTKMGCDVIMTDYPDKLYTVQQNMNK